MMSLDQALARVAKHADPQWSLAALDITNDLAIELPLLHTDMVWARLDKLPFETHEHRAMGSIISIAKSLGWIEALRCEHCSTETVNRKSDRPGSNQRLIAWYVSKMYKGNPDE